MDPALPKSSPDKSNARASFRRPSNDAANRKYRRHSPLGDSDSYSSGGSPKRERSRSPVHSKEDHSKRSDDQRRKDDGRELEKEYNCYRSTREHDSHRHSDRHTYGTSRDFHRHDRSRYRRHADEDERNYHRSSRSGRELRDDSCSDRVRHDRASDRSRDSWRDVGNHSRDKYENAEYRSKRKERETDAQEHYRYSDKDYDKAVSGSRQTNSGIDYGKSGERDRQKNREAQDDKRDYHGSPGNYKNDRSSLHDDLREPGKDLASGRDSGCLRLKETHKSSNKEIDEQEDLVQKKHSNWESDRRKEKRMKEPEEERQNENRILSSYQERDGRYEQHLDKSSNVIDRQNSSATRLKLGNAVDEKPSSSLKQLEDMDEKVTSEPMGSFTIQAGGGSDLNAAKVAAMKAAELDFVDVISMMPECK